MPTPRPSSRVHPGPLLALLAASACAKPAAPVVSPAAPPLVCADEAAHPKDAVEFRAGVEADPWYLYAVNGLGEPTACAMDWSEFEGQVFPSVTYTFGKGVYAVKTLPPESSIQSLTFQAGFPDPKAAEGLLRADPNFKTVNWTQPEVATEPDGTVRKTFWDQDGSNIGVDLVYRGETLIGIGAHMAL